MVTNTVTEPDMEVFIIYYLPRLPSTSSSTLDYEGVWTTNTAERTTSDRNQGTACQINDDMELSFVSIAYPEHRSSTRKVYVPLQLERANEQDCLPACLSAS
jgi:hypothetical protein